MQTAAFFIATNFTPMDLSILSRLDLIVAMATWIRQPFGSSHMSQLARDETALAEHLPCLLVHNIKAIGPRILIARPANPKRAEPNEAKLFFLLPLRVGVLSWASSRQHGGCSVDANLSGHGSI